MLPRKSKYRDISGKIFDQLKVLKYLGTKHDCALWLCRCYCGRTIELTIAQLNRTNRPTRSCGKCEYDHYYPSEYNSWRNMRQRCYNPHSDDYKNYGARGIIVCARWQTFIYFLEDLGLKESPILTLERNNTNGNYEPGNCRWATRFEQNCNKRNITKFDFLKQDI